MIFRFSSKKWFLKNHILDVYLKGPSKNISKKSLFSDSKKKTSLFRTVTFQLIFINFIINIVRFEHINLNIKK